MQNTYACKIGGVSDMHFSGSSGWSREVWVLRSHLDTLPDMCGNHTWQLLIKRD